MTARLPWGMAWRIARRELSARFRGLRLLLVCLFLGVGALSAIGTLTGSIADELETRGREILGGDVEASVWQREPSSEELAAIRELGTVSTGYRMQAIAVKGELSAPIALKSVDSNWPLIGTLELADGRKVGAPPSGVVYLSQGTAERLDLSKGASITIGGTALDVGGIIAKEPEKLGEGFNLGDIAITRDDMPRRAGLTAPGAMYRTKTRAVLKPGIDPGRAIKDIEERFPAAGFEFRTRDNASPGTERFVSRMGEFLVLVGLAALVIAGIGIGGGVSSYLEARRASIATFKVLGATSQDIARIYLLQIGLAAVVGSLAGLTAGVLVTPLLGQLLGEILPVSPGFVLDGSALLTASTYGLLVAFIFSAPPLIRAKSFPAMALMRARVSPLTVPPRQLFWTVGAGLAAIVATVLVTASNPQISALFLAGAAGVLGFLGLLGWAIRKGAEHVPRPRNPLLRAGLANLHRPSAQTGSLVTALGFGLSAFVLLAAIQTSLDANIRARIPHRAPDYFVLDVPKDGEEQFRQAVLDTVPRAQIRTVPALRARILAYGPESAMTRVSNVEHIPDNAWALRGERGITYHAKLPQGNEVIRGEWWPADWVGEPLVSVEDELADAVGIEIGDMMTISVLGVERSARVASIRRIDWQNLSFNNVLVFSPNTLADVPHNLAATINVPAGVTTQGLLGQLVRAFPSTSVIETGGLLREARALLSQMSAAILSAASVAVLAGLAVLLGAIAAARASRTYDNVILRVLGASRRQLLLLQLAEYGLLALILSGVALVLGSAIGWAVITGLFEFDWLPDWPKILAVLVAGVALILGFALAGSLQLLRAKPAQALREL
ncbi:MAG: FtsX-like permease family protein [Sphingomonadaceae bacterium]|nr:FtsX-like permease family protein [Sphingomonadaceae bacterium]